MVVHCGATPVFTDVRDDFNMDPEAVTAAINERTKVIMPVDFGGWPVRLPRTERACSANRCSREIQAELKRASDTRKNTRLIGFRSFHLVPGITDSEPGLSRDCSVFSFHAVKNLTTAEGSGCTESSCRIRQCAIYQNFVSSPLHGQNKDALAKMQKGNWRYDIVEAGYKMNMTDLLAAIGLVELARYDRETLPKRKAIYEAYRRELGVYSWAELPCSWTRPRIVLSLVFPSNSWNR